MSSSLLTAARLGALQLTNRVEMPPDALPTNNAGHVPSGQMANYYVGGSSAMLTARR